MHWNKKKEDRTPEDYQKKANEQIQELKNQWKTFFLNRSHCNSSCYCDDCS